MTGVQTPAESVPSVPRQGKMPQNKSIADYFMKKRPAETSVKPSPKKAKCEDEPKNTQIQERSRSAEVVSLQATTSTPQKLVPSLETNKKIVSILSELGKVEKEKGDMMRAKAYRTAAEAIKSHGSPVSSGAEAKKLKGVGQKIAKKIDEILESGELQKLNTMKEDPVAKSLADLQRIIGIGPKAAQGYLRNGIKSVEELRQALTTGKVTLSHHIQLGLKYEKDLELRIPRAEINELKDAVEKVVAKVDKDSSIEVMGSYRRGLPESGDIDVLLSQEHDKSYLDQVVAELKNAGLIKDTISHGKVSYMGMCQLNPTKPVRRIDIKFFEKKVLPFAVLYFTGSGFFNTKMRMHALEMDLKLNEHGLFKQDGTSIECKTEKDIFEKLGLDWVEPPGRDGSTFV